MMSVDKKYDFGYGKIWTEIYVDRKEGYKTSVVDYHEHDFYEINLVISGNIKALLSDRFEEGCANYAVMTAPHTPHYITCHPDTLYSRLYLLFTHRYMAELFEAHKGLADVFGENGRILTLTPSQTDEVKSIIQEIDRQKNPLGKKLLVSYLLVYLSETTRGEPDEGDKKPGYIMRAISYIEDNYKDKIIAAELASMLYMGRTAFMTEFKLRTGRTFNEYLTDCRLKHASKLIGEGKTLEYTAEKCGFSDSSGLARAFKRRYHCTPKQYVARSQKAQLPNT